MDAEDFLAKQSRWFTPTQTPKATQTKGRGGTLTSLISEGGALGGAAAGATIGSAVPILGTAIGGIIGAGLGAFGGRLAENQVRDSRWGVGDAAKEGAISAVLSGPLRLAKYGTTAAKGIKTGVTLEKALTEAAQGASNMSIRGALGKKSLEAADRAITKQFKLTPSQLTNFSRKHGEDATKVIKRFGINNADEITAKGIQPLQGAFDDVVQKIPAISSKSLQASLSKVYSPLIKSANLSEQALGSQIKAQADEIIKKSGELIPSTEVNALKKSFDDFVNYTMRGTPEHNVNKMTADALRKTMQEAADKAGLGYQGKTFKEIGRDLSKLYELDDIVGRQANLGRGSNPIGLTNLLGMTAGAAGGGGPGMIGGTLLTSAINSNAGRRVAREGAENIGQRLTGSAANSLGVRGAVTGAARGAAGASLADAITQSSLPNQTTQAYMTNAPIKQTTAQNISTSPYQTGENISNPFSKENILEAMLIDIQTTGGKNLDKIQMLSEFANPAADQKPLNQNQQERSDLITALDNVESIIGGGSINYGPIASRVEGIKGIFNAADQETLSFKNAIGQVRGAITKARAGASLTPGELKLLDQYTPKDTDSEQVVLSKLQQLRNLYGYSAPTQGGNSLEDALLGLGYGSSSGIM